MKYCHVAAITTLVFIFTASVAWAQSVHIGIVASLSGSASDAGMAQEAAVAALKAELAATGIHGLDVELSIIDDRSLPDLTLDIVRGLVEEGAHALICCTTLSATRLVAPYLHQQGVLTLSPSGLPSSSGDLERPFWTFSLRADERTIMAAIALHLANSGVRSVGLMTLDNSFGRVVRDALSESLATARVDLAGEALYRPGVTVLTPEALWVATKQPGAVVVWGLEPDVALAVSGLRQRGYEGPIYVSSEFAPRIDIGYETIRVGELRSTVMPIAVVDTLDETHASYVESTSFASIMRARYGRERVPVEGASTYDAVRLLVKGIEQVMVLGISPKEISQFRQALRDSVIGLQPITGASGILDLIEQSVNATLPKGLAVAVVRAGTLHHLP